MSSPSSRNEVLIVGAGPSGLMMAAQLLRWGVRPRIIDARPGPSTQTRAVGIQARSVEILEQMGLAGIALVQGIPARVANIFGDRGRLGRIEIGHIGEGLSPFPYMLILPQDRTEAILCGDLNARGLEVEWNTRLEHLVPTSDGVQAVLEHAGQAQTAQFRFLLGADGAHSEVRRGLKLEFEGSTYDHRFFVTDLRVEGEAVEGEINMFVSNRFYVMGLMPLSGPRRFRLIGICPESLAHLEHPTFADLKPHLDTVLG